MNPLLDPYVTDDERTQIASIHDRAERLAEQVRALTTEFEDLFSAITDRCPDDIEQDVVALSGLEAVNGLFARIETLRK